MHLEEKKVEYIELIYDLIFVYLVGRNNSLLHTMEGGFFSLNTFFVYVVSSLAILQIWYFSSLLINRYGSNGVSDHVCLFINMYLLYYLADATRIEWFAYYVRYNVAWGLILVNLAAQYFRLLRSKSGAAAWESRHLRYHMRLLLAQAVWVFCSIPLYGVLHFPLSWLSIPAGFLAALLTEKIDALVPVNFEHLTERVMLYVVFTFGEMIVGIADYFEDEFTFTTFYFSLMAFLTVAGLFLSYGFLYNHVIDRERTTTGTSYILIHLALVIALNNITVALEFMPKAEVDAVAKNSFIVASFLAYYIFLFFIERFAQERFRTQRMDFARLLLLAFTFVLLMSACYRSGWASIAVTVAYIYLMFTVIVRHCLRAEKTNGTSP